MRSPQPDPVAARARECQPDGTDLRWEVAFRERGDMSVWQGFVRDFVRCVLRVPATPADTPEVERHEVLEVAPNVDRLHVWYSTEALPGRPSRRVPAFLFVPRGSGPVPAVIVYHGHGPGKIAAAEPIEHQPESALALEIARTLGYVVLAPDSQTFGEFSFADHAAYFRSIVAADAADSYIAHIVADGRADMAVLRAHPQVDVHHIGVAGVSMGSWRAMLHAVITPDVQASVVSALYLPFDELFSPRHDPCQHVPALAIGLRMQDLALSMFDRDLLVQWGELDGAFTLPARVLLDDTREAFHAIGADSRVVIDVDPSRSHQFGVESAIRFFEARLGRGAWDRVHP